MRRSASEVIGQILSGLNPPQRRAVVAPAGPLLVLAGAGSGKTRMLTRRGAYALGTGRVRGSQLLAITFTNKAAGELAARLADLVGADVAGQITSGTFHSVCNRMVRAHAPLVGRTGQYSIYDAADSRRVLAAAVKDSGQEHIDLAAAQRQISNHKARLLTPSQVEDTDPQLAAVWARYEELLERSDALDFDDLLGQAVRLLAGHEEVRCHYQQRWQMVLVDEYQDTNPAQHRLLLSLCAGPAPNLTVTGDDDQSIYSFRSAEIENILGFGRDWPEAGVVRLEQNYRSTRAILDAANGLIAHNQGRHPKRLWTDSQNGQPVAVSVHQDEQAEARATAAWASALIAQGVAAGEIAVLFRTRALARPVEHALLLAGVPHRMLGGGGLLERAEVKDALAHLAVVANPHDRVAFARAMTRPRRGIGPAALAHLAGHADQCGLDLLACCQQAHRIGGLTKAQAQALADYAAAVSPHARDSEQELPEKVGQILLATGLPDAVRKSGGEKSVEQLERLRGLVRAAREYHDQAQQDPDSDRDGTGDRTAPTLADFLANAILVAGEDSTDDDQVTLATVHAAKGAEWRHVRIMALEEGTMPHQRAVAEGGEEEERRLAYVAITRAQERLVVSYAHGRQGRGRAASRFLAQAGL